MFMKVAPPLEKYYEHTSLDLLMKQINDHVKIQDYYKGLTRSDA